MTLRPNKPPRKPFRSIGDELRNPGVSLASNFPEELVPEEFVRLGTHRDAEGNLVLPAAIARRSSFTQEQWIEAVEQEEKAIVVRARLAEVGLVLRGKT